jgi:hypothetical protein
MAKRHDFEDDGMTVADMSDIHQQPLLIPDLGFLMGRKGGDKTDKTEERPVNRGPVQVDRAERRAMIGGTITAYLVAFGIFAAVFVIVILLLIWLGR